MSNIIIIIYPTLNQKNLSLSNIIDPINFITLYLLENKYNYIFITKSTSYIVMIVIEIHVSSICKTANS
jgi:hypothetical protein